jgi:hypothetical protein
VKVAGPLEDGEFFQKGIKEWAFVFPGEKGAHVGNRRHAVFHGSFTQGEGKQFCENRRGATMLVVLSAQGAVDPG